jgi:hypothetical protein
MKMAVEVPRDMASTRWLWFLEVIGDGCHDFLALTFGDRLDHDANDLVGAIALQIEQ